MKSNIASFSGEYLRIQNDRTLRFRQPEGRAKDAGVLHTLVAALSAARTCPRAPPAEPGGTGTAFIHTATDMPAQKTGHAPSCAPIPGRAGQKQAQSAGIRNAGKHQPGPHKGGEQDEQRVHQPGQQHAQQNQ